MRTSFVEKAPQLLDEWSAENTGIIPEKISYGSNKKVIWDGKCGHRWEATIKNRVNGHGCPVCTGNVIIPGINDLTTGAPEIAREWSDKNKGISPEEIAVHSPRKVWWRCNVCSQEWEARVADRVDGHGCPVCSGARLAVGFNDLATEFPKIAEEWSDRNARAPNEYFSRATDNVWWKCSSCHAEWQGVIAARIKGRQCPVCKKVYHGLSIHERIKYYADMEGIHFVRDDESKIGLPLSYYFDEAKTALEIAKKPDYYPQELKRVKAINRSCEMSGILMIRILFPGADEIPGCVCIRRNDKTWEADEAAVGAAMQLIIRQKERQIVAD